MSKQTPKQLVEKQFGTRADLVQAILGLVDDDGHTRKRLMGTTNKKLLRIHEVAATVQSTIGNKAGLIDAIAERLRSTTKTDQDEQGKPG